MDRPAGNGPLLSRRALLGMAGGLGLALVGCSGSPRRGPSASPSGTGPPIPEGPTRLGAYVVPRTGDPVVTGVAMQDSVLDFERTIGRTLSIMHVYRNWREPWGDLERWAVDGGRIPFVNWNARRRWAAIAAGQEDAQIDDVAATASSIGSPVWVSFNAEPERTPGAPGDYVAAFARVAARFASAGVTNVRWAFVLTNASFSLKAAIAAGTWFSGLEDVVDLVGTDAFNFAKVYGHCSVPWTDTSVLLDGFRSWADGTGLPALVGETASLQDLWTPDPARRATWYANTASFIAKDWPDLAAWVYFAGRPAGGYAWDGRATLDCAGHRNSWFPDFDPDSLAAFRSLAGGLG